MRSFSEMDAFSEMFFFIFLNDSGMLLVFHLSRLTDLIDFYVFQCNLKPRLNYQERQKLYK